MDHKPADAEGKPACQLCISNPAVKDGVWRVGKSINKEGGNVWYYLAG
jgi:hypothetical protein